MSTLTEADIIVLKNLRYDIQNDIQDSSTAAAAARPNRPKSDDDDDSVRPILEQLSRESSAFTTWDNNEINPTLDRLVVQPYLAWASKLVRQDPDTVFITHIIVHFTTLLPSALYLYYSFSWLHAVLHTVYAVWNAGPFTLLLHNHIHNNGLLGKQYALFDRLFPYITGPLMGHTWDSYYYHHVKMHHVEGNGPGDLSSTIYFQRDEPLEFIRYFVRFLIFTWLELPIYFFRNKKYDLAAKALISECSSMGFIYLAARLNTRPTVFVLILPFFIMRLGMMIGNFGQHCLVDNVDPMSDYRSSITLIDVPVSPPRPLSSTGATNTNTPPEQPPLLQRRLPHLAPPQPATPLESPPRRLPQSQTQLPGRGRADLHRHRLPDDHVPVHHQGLRLPRAPAGADGRADRDDA